MRLPPVKAGPVYAKYKNSWQSFVPIWEFFKITELTEVM